MYRCAGEVAAAKNNFCGVGVAYNARIAGTALTSVFKYTPPPNTAPPLTASDLPLSSASDF